MTVWSAKLAEVVPLAGAVNVVRFWVKAGSVARSILKPVSLLELSLQVRLACGPCAAVPARPVGAAGGGAAGTRGGAGGGFAAAQVRARGLFVVKGPVAGADPGVGTDRGGAAGPGVHAGHVAVPPVRPVRAALAGEIDGAGCAPAAARQAAQDEARL